MTRRRDDPCVAFRPTLVDFVERRALGPDSPAALDHLGRCMRCERDLTEVAQTVIALRRLGARASAVEAPADGWAMLRERLERSQRAADDAARRFRRAFGGAVVAVAVVAMIAIPSLTGTVTLSVDSGAESMVGARPPAEARRYDPHGLRLTEGIVLAIAGREPGRFPLAERVSARPMSTDRRRPSRGLTNAPTIPLFTAPRTAYRT